MPIIMGCDPSMNHTGIVVMNTDTFDILWQGGINNPSGSSKEGVTPFAKIRDSIKAVVAEHKVEHVYLERMFQSRNPAITEVLFVAAFMVKLACHDMGVPFTVVAIMGKDGWKNFTLGYDYTKQKGNLSKQATRRATEKALGVKFGTEHQADAGSIGLAGWYLETGIDFRTVLGADIPEGIGMVADKPKRLGGRKPRASKPGTDSSTPQHLPGVL